MTTQLRLALALVATIGCGFTPPGNTAGDAVAGDDAATTSVDVPVEADALPSDPILPLQGAIAPVHDPAIIQADGVYYVFSTGNGIQMRMSTDLVHWSIDGQAFASAPTWITTSDPDNRNALWAPDVSYFGGRYHLYYAASTFGSNTSCIGHATTASPANNSWLDEGAVICSTSTDDWNAIDPNLIIDTDGAAWLAFGSFWSGLKLIPLDETGARSGTEVLSLATRDNTAVEAAFIVSHDGFYYLFESVDFCCRGVDSTYKIAVGRSTDIRGPYLDEDDKPLLSGGGTILVEGDARWHGPGHNAILRTTSTTYNVYHSYDADNGGTPTLRIVQLTWSADGWPISAGP